MLGLLKCCPFCRSMNSDVIECDVASWAVTCRACGVIGPAAATAREAMERWNERKDADAADSAETGAAAPRKTER